MINGSRTARTHSLPRLMMVLVVLAIPTGAIGAAAEEPSTSAIMQRLEALEAQNRELARQVEELRHQNETLTAKGAAPDVAHASEVAHANAAAATPATAAAASDPMPDWVSRIGFNGDFRFRHETIEDTALADDRTRESIRARLNASIRLHDSLNGEIGFASGGRDPRGGSSTLGATSSRKETGLDLAYVTWRPIRSLAVTAGKMRQPFFRPGASTFIDSEIRPEGVAIAYQDPSGIFGSAFHYWLEERASQADSTLLGGQLGWGGEIGAVALKVGAGYYDYGSVQGRQTGFGGGLLNELGNSVIGSGASAVFRYDYDIAQLFAQADFMIGALPVQLFSDLARNSAADDGLDTAYSLGFLVGKANAPGHWEFGAYKQKVEQDALFGQWLESDFAGGVTDSEGYVYRVARMVAKHVLLNLTYLDTAYDVDLGAKGDYDRWQLDFNFMF